MIKKLKFKKMILSCTLGFCAGLEADTKSQVEGWFNSMNYANVTEAGIYEGQSARYATLGGVSTRSEITQPFNLVDVQTPSFSAGCGGIDIYLGGFSAVDSDQFVENLRAIGQNAQSLAYMLAIQIVSPQLSGIMNDIQNQANKYLNMNMDSCEAASGLVEGGLAMLDKEKANCIATRRNSYGEDFSTASFQCSTGGARKSTTGAGGDKNSADFVEGNLAWYVLMQDPFFSNDLGFAELVMNITGTMIITPTSGNFDSPTQIKIVQPSITSDTEKERFSNIYNSLLHGKKSSTNLSIYRCSTLDSNKTGCQSVSSSLQKVTPTWDGLYDKVNAMMASITAKIHTDSELTSQEKGLISNTRIPIYRYLSAITTAYPSTVNLEGMTSDFVTLISEDILLNALSAIIQRVELASGSLENGLSISNTIIGYQDQLVQVMAGISGKKKENEMTADAFLKMREQINQYERELMPKLSGHIISSSGGGY